jgi:hypothetical protein
MRVIWPMASRFAAFVKKFSCKPKQDATREASRCVAQAREGNAQ